MDRVIFNLVLVFGTIMGLSVGSFLNVVIHRVPRGESIVNPPSHCPSCKRRIRWYENIPLLSFVVLRGRCSGCGARISWRYPLVELLGGLVVVISLLDFGLSWRALGGILLGWNLIALGFIDYETKTVPDAIVLTMALPGLLVAWLGGSWTGLGLALLSVAILGGFFWIVRKFATAWLEREALGGGDVIMAGGIGVYLHPLYLPIFLLIATASVLIASLIWAWVKQRSLREVEISFGPGLAVGGWLTFQFGVNAMGGLMLLAQPLLR